MLSLVDDVNATPDGATTTGTTLLRLQGIDTAIDQARHRKSHLDEQRLLEQASAELAAWTRKHLELASIVDDATKVLASCEARTDDIDTSRQRLEQQLRTVIAPREAEALQHEIANLATERSELDETALEAMERQAEAEDAMNELTSGESSIRDAVEQAQRQLEAVLHALDESIAALEIDRRTLTVHLPESLLAQYERIRSKNGVAAARLNGVRCDGCHLDLSAAEVDEVRAADERTVPECPQCGRLLVR